MNNGFDKSQVVVLASGHNEAPATEAISRVPGQASADASVLEDVREEMVRSETRAVPAIAPSPWMQDLVNTLSHETLAQTASNLGSIDDMHLADTSVGTRIARFQGSFQVVAVTRLGRVRKLLSSPPAEVLPLIRPLLAHAVGEADRAREEMDQLMAQNGGVVHGDLTAWTKLQESTAASVYIVTELGDRHSLKLLADLYRQVNHEPQKMETVVPRDLLVRAMAKRIALPGPVPSEPAVLELHSKCISSIGRLKADNHIEAATWKDLVPEHDPRFILMKQQTGLEGREKMELNIWQLEYDDGGVMANNNILTDEARTLGDDLAKLIELTNGR
jgi:hypothetical protein